MYGPSCPSPSQSLKQWLGANTDGAGQGSLPHLPALPGPVTCLKTVLTSATLLIYSGFWEEYSERECLTVCLAVVQPQLLEAFGMW